MTREEAITILYAMKADNLKLDDPYSRYRYDAVNIAIKALEQLTSYERTINKLTKAISEYEPIADRIEYGTDGNAYRLTVSNGKEFKKEPILDKIRAEIMQLYNEVEVVDYDHNDISRIKRAHWIIREEVLWILDKYNSHQKRGADMREGGIND